MFIALIPCESPASPAWHDKLLCASGTNRYVERERVGWIARTGEGLEERGEVCLAEEVERLRRLGLSDGEVAGKLGVDVSWVETLISPGEDEPDPEA